MREHIRADDDRREGERVLRADRIANHQPRERQWRQPRRPGALAHRDREGPEAEHRGEHVREQQRRERQQHRAQPQHDRGRSAVARLEALSHAPHQDQQHERRQHGTPETDEVDHLVFAAQSVRRPCGRGRVDRRQQLVEGQRVHRQPGRARRIPVAPVEGLVFGRVRAAIDCRASRIERAHEVVVGTLVVRPVLQHRPRCDGRKHDRRQRQAPTARSFAPPCTGALAGLPERVSARSLARGGAHCVLATASFRAAPSGQDRSHRSRASPPGGA